MIVSGSSRRGGIASDADAECSRDGTAKDIPAHLLSGHCSAGDCQSDSDQDGGYAEGRSHSCCGTVGRREDRGHQRRTGDETEVARKIQYSGDDAALVWTSLMPSRSGVPVLVVSTSATRPLQTRRLGLILGEGWGRGSSNRGREASAHFFRPLPRLVGNKRADVDYMARHVQTMKSWMAEFSGVLARSRRVAARRGRGRKR